jgi:hypothetical protein
VIALACGGIEMADARVARYVRRWNASWAKALSD